MEVRSIDCENDLDFTGGRHHHTGYTLPLRRRCTVSFCVYLSFSTRNRRLCGPMVTEPLLRSFRRFINVFAGEESPTLHACPHVVGHGLTAPARTRAVIELWH